jgi:hypothetical protein
MNGLDSKIRMGASPRELPEVLRTANHKLWQDAATARTCRFLIYEIFIQGL